MRAERSALAAPAAALLVALLIVVGIFVYLSILPRQAPSTSSSTSSTLSTSSSTSTSTQGGTLTTSYTSTNQTTVFSASTNSSLLTRCSGSQPPAVGNSLEFGDVVTGTSSPAIVCVELYYFAATAETFNLTTAFSIQAQRSGQSFSGGSNFTVSSSQDEVLMGGPSNLGEGTVVAYSITAKPGASGTYELGFTPAGVSGTLGRFLMESQEPASCPYYGQVVAGDGSPNYVLPSGCLTISSSYYCSSTTSSSTSQCTTIPGVTYPLVGGDLYFRVVGVTNSTQSG